MVKRTIILAAGGTGGHVFPAQALAETLILKGWKVYLITDQRGSTFANAFPRQVERLILNISNPRRGGILKFIRYFVTLISSTVITFRFFRKVRVTIVVGFGGYPSASSMLVASLMRIPTVIHEQNAVLGRVNKIFQNHAKLLAFGIEPKLDAKKTVKTIVLGNPIRQSVMKVAPLDYLQLQSSSFLILVLGGSQGARFVSSIACDAITNLPNQMKKKITVLHQCKKEDILLMRQRYRQFEVKAEIKSFFTNIPFCLNQANLVISRSGASSLAEFCIFGRPSILIPLPSAVGNHQVLNAEVMADHGASVILDQRSLTSTALGHKISYILANSKIANQMAVSAKNLAKPDAASNFVVELDNLTLKEI